VFERTLGPEVTVIGVRAAESQRRNGALHCSAAAYYAR
jgi:agmatine/peptidylarginine deiminase